MTDELPPLSPLVSGLVAEERARDEVSPEVAARLLARLAPTVGAAAPLTGVALKIGSGLATLLVGGIIGAWVHAMVAPERVVTVFVPAPVVAPAAVIEAPDPVVEASAPTIEAPTPMIEVPAPIRSTVVTRKALSPEDLSSRERALIEHARSAVARGRAADALEAIELHRRTFGKGTLAEERDLLLIHALTLAGQVEEAARARESFREEYPESLFSVDQDERSRAP